MKKIFKISISIISIFIIVIFYISYITNKNQEQYNIIAKDVQKNYKLKEDITYSNQYGNYYIITTNDKVIVLNKEYQEVLNENISILTENKNNLPLIYKTNKLMYEKTKRKENEIIYEYYDATTGELIKTTALERQ